MSDNLDPRPFDYGWYETDERARTACRLTEDEIARFRDADQIGYRPALLPDPDNIVGANRYYNWPAAVNVGTSMVVLFNRRGLHYIKGMGGAPYVTDETKRRIHDADSGTRMVACSHDLGRTWSKPFDLFSLGRWNDSPVGMWGGSIGVHGDTVYVLIHEGLYRSTDRGASWEFVEAAPDWGDVPPSRVASLLCFDDEHGLILWTTSQHEGDRLPHYGRIIRAVYSPDFGKTWKYEEQAIPDSIPNENMSFCEFTPLQLDDGRMIFFNRNGRNGTTGPFAQVWSKTGWFPFNFDLTSAIGWTDTPGLILNPKTGRLEAQVSQRRGEGPGPDTMKLNLYSIDPEDVFQRNSTKWRYEGTLLAYDAKFGENRCDGINPLSNVVIGDWAYTFCWAGNGANVPLEEIESSIGGIFMVARSLDTPAVSRQP